MKSNFNRSLRACLLVCLAALLRRRHLLRKISTPSSSARRARSRSSPSASRICSRTRYDLADRPAKGVTMSRGKPVQEGVRVKLAKGMTWDKLAAMSPEEIKSKNALAGRLLPAAASASRSGRHDLPQAAHRRRRRSRPIAT